ncbi:MAG: anti-sigma factor antagonist [Thermoleophilaceae bacterium]|jgi:anti-sigma B factor antagonist|nr:anti-sigma factor antagonist [Thermoleophilaceae bacterium]
MASGDLTVEEQVLDGVHLIAADGELDNLTCKLVADALRRATHHGEGPVVLDLGQTAFIDSAGISTLLNALRRLTRQRRRMVVVCPPGPSRRVFELLGLVGTFELFDTRKQAFATV